LLRFEVLTAVDIIMVSWDVVMPYRYRYETIRRHIQESRNHYFCAVAPFVTEVIVIVPRLVPEPLASRQNMTSVLIRKWYY
jgi:hypothetical protein